MYAHFLNFRLFLVLFVLFSVYPKQKKTFTLRWSLWLLHWFGHLGLASWLVYWPGQLFGYFGFAFGFHCGLFDKPLKVNKTRNSSQLINVQMRATPRQFILSAGFGSLCGRSNVRNGIKTDRYLSHLSGISIVAAAISESVCDLTLFKVAHMQLIYLLKAFFGLEIWVFCTV